MWNGSKPYQAESTAPHNVAPNTAHWIEWYGDRILGGGIESRVYTVGGQEV